MDKLYFLAVFVGASTFFACGSSDANSSGGSSVSEVDGTWLQACEADDGTSNKGSNVFGGGRSSITQTYYSDANCTTEAWSIVMTSTYTLGAAVTIPAGAKEVNSTVSKAVVTMKDQNYVDLFNGQIQGAPATCGGGFVKDVPKELNATTCASDANFKKLFTDTFGIYKIDGTKLYSGNCGDSGTDTDCTSATKRPKTLKTDPLTKV